MIRKKWLINFGLTSGLIGIVLFIWQRQLTTSSTQEQPRRRVAPASSPASTNQTRPSERSLPAPFRASDVVQSKIEPVNPEAAFKLHANQVIATVNGVQIVARDLMPFAADSASDSKMITPEMFKFLRGLAIERELVFQAAAAQAIELTGEQQQRLEQIRESLLGRERAESGQVVHLNRSGTLEDQIAFELRDAKSRFLQSSLLTKAGAPSAFVTEAGVEQYYRQHIDEYASLPQNPGDRSNAWQKIDLEIRQKLAPQVQAEYQERVQKYLEQLGASANIVAAEPAS